jgi:hypothetical protein
MLSRRNWLIIGACFLAVGLLLYCLFFLLSLGGTSWGIWIGYGANLFIILAAVCFVWASVRDMPGWEKARGLGILALAISPILYLAWISKDPRRGAELLPHASFLVAVIAALIAALSGRAASNAAESASKSLELARTITRPFLNVHVNLVTGASLNRAILALTIQNTGNLPADHVVVECSWYLIKGEGTEECSLKLEKASPSIVFPADRVESTYLVKGRDAVGRLTNEGGRVNVTVNYQNKLTMQRHTTQRTFCIVVASVSPSINTHQAVSIPEEDYWD